MTPDRYDPIYRDFRWHVPPDFNIAEACCGRWARQAPRAVAIVHETEDGRITRHTYGELQQAANRLSNALQRLGLRRGDRVAIVMPQRFETAVCHMAVHQLGAVSMPLSMLFGPEALAYRLQHSEARLALVDESAVANLLEARKDAPCLEAVIAVGEAQGQGDLDWEAALARESAEFASLGAGAEDAAVLIYTSGTTGPPKGALIPHRALIGNLSGFIASQNGFGFKEFQGAPQQPAVPLDVTGFQSASKSGTGPLPSGKGERGMGGNEAGPRPGEGHRPDQGPLPSGKGERGMGVTRVGLRPSQRAIFWSPADWAWTGGLMDALLPTLYFGRTIVGYQGRFGAEKAFELMERHRVTHTFLFPTALKAMMKAVPHPRSRYRLELQAVMSAGEAVGDAVFAYGERELGLQINEMFGQTEINYVVGNCSVHWPARPGSMGRAYPGHRVAVIDDEGRECPPGTPGDVAVHRRDIHGHPDPVFFLGYWRNDAATRAKFTGDPDDSWCRTGDTAVMDGQGYLWYQGRSDDVFKAAGYRIGPSEIENCLVKHPAVANAAVVPKPDAERGALVKAYVVLAAGAVAGPELVEELQRHVRGRLAPYEYPKEIEFIDALPMTTTGKVQRRVLRLQEEQRAAGRAGP